MPAWGRKKEERNRKSGSSTDSYLDGDDVSPRGTEEKTGGHEFEGAMSQEQCRRDVDVLGVANFISIDVREWLG